MLPEMGSFFQFILIELSTVTFFLTILTFYLIRNGIPEHINLGIHLIGGFQKKRKYQGHRHRISQLVGGQVGLVTTLEKVYYKLYR